MSVGKRLGHMFNNSGFKALKVTKSPFFIIDNTSGAPWWPIIHGK
jgi:hypothetical protein